MSKEYLKQQLDNKSSLRGLLFRRGYLLTTAKVTNTDDYPFYGLWRELSIDDRLHLYVHQNQTSYIFQEKDVTVSIIGHAYNPFDGVYDENKLCQELLTAYQKGLDAYFDKLSEFTGLHVIILVDGSCVRVCQDACALTGCFHGIIDGNLYVAEHSQLIADICNLDYNPTVFKLVKSRCYNIGNRHLPGNLTPYKELKRNGGNTYIEYDGKSIVTKRFFPVKPHPEFTSSEDKTACVKRIAELMHSGIECCTKKWSNCAISLTGGTDSKTTLACANGLYDKFQYFSFVSKPQEQVDANGAAELCRQLGLKHTLYPIPAENSTFPDFELIKLILNHNSAYTQNNRDSEIRKFIYLHDHNYYDVELKSWASEVPRVFLERKYQLKMPSVLTERHCSIFQTRYFLHPLLLRWSDQQYYKFLREIHLEKPLFNYEHTDSFYWEIRMGAWGQAVISTQQIYHRMTIPMNNRKILDMFLCLPREERKRDDAHKAVMRVMNPKVVEAGIEIPNLYFHSYRIWMEKLYYLYRTFFYRPIR